jgi:ankyrin repeat protein
MTDTDIDELFTAVGTGNRALIGEILRNRPELARARDAGSLSVLQFARYMDQKDILRLLVGAAPPLDVFEAAVIDDAPHIRTLLAADSAVATAFSDDGFTALHFASYFGSVDAMKTLIGAGAKLEAVTTNFLTNMPLHAAAAGGRIEAVRTLLEAGADPNARQHGGFTALMTAAFSNRRDMAELLIAFNADVTVRNDEGKTAAELGGSMGNMELAARLRLEERHVDHGLRAPRGATTNESSR